MSFICGQCHHVVAHHISPSMKTIRTKPVVYVNYDLEGDEVISKGEEIVKEIGICPACAAEGEKE